MTVRRTALAIYTLTITLTVTAIIVLLASRDAPVPDSWGFRGFTTTFALGFGTVGLLIVRARGNLVGWLLLVAGLISGFQDFAEEYAIYSVFVGPRLPLTELMAWSESWSWVVTVAMVGIYLPLLFPTGRLPSPRWRPVAALGALAAFGLAGGLMINEGPLNNAPFVRNPFGIPGIRLIDIAAGSEASLTSAFFVLYVGLFLSAVGAVASLVGRFRTTRGIEHQQIKWFALGAAFAAAGMIVGGALQQYKAAQALFILAIQIIPFTVAVAILRYRLYDIDLVINRALVYGVTVAIVGAGFVGAALFLQTLLRPITSGSDVAIAASTLATVAAFQPLRRWVQGAIDRRFYRSRYDAERTLDAFSSRLKDEVDLDALERDMLDVVRDTVRPTHAGVWLREVRP